MKTLICLIIFLASITLAESPPSSDGQFFYCDMLYDQGTHTHKIPILAGTNNDKKLFEIVPSAAN